MVIKKMPKECDVKIEKKFLWKPTRINDEIRWLELRYVSYIYLHKKWRIYNYLKKAEIDGAKFLFNCMALAYVILILSFLLILFMEIMKG